MNVKEVYKDNNQYVHGVVKGYFAGHYQFEWIVSEVESNIWYNVVRKLHQFNHDSEIRTWLHRISINECKNMMIKRAKRYEGEAKHSNKFLRRAWPRWDWNTPENNLIAEQVGEEIAHEYQNLPKIEKDMFEARYVNDKSYGECCDLFKIKIGTVKSRIHRTVNLIGRRDVESMQMPRTEDVPKVYPLEYEEAS